MDREIQKKSFNYKPLLYGVLTVGLLVTGGYYARTLLTKQLKSSEIILVKVRKGDLENTVSATGFVRPASEVVITSPLATKIQHLKKRNGDKVGRGDEIVVLEQEFATLEYNRLQDELELKENNVNRLRLRLEKGIRDIEIDDQIEQLQVQNLSAQVKDLKHLQKVGGATQEEVTQAENQLRIVRLRKQKLENNLQYQKASIDAEVQNEQLQSSIQRKLMEQLAKKIEQTHVLSPINGVVTWVNPTIGVQVQEGEPISRVADLSKYHIEATVSDMHTKKIHIGQSVRIRINNDFLEGTVEQILPAVDNGAVQFKIALANPSSNLLRPSMQVDIDIILSKKENTLYVKNGRAYKGGKIQKFFVRNGDVLEQKELTIGLTNSKTIEIVSGAGEGDEIVMSNMDRYEDMPSITYQKED